MPYNKTINSLELANTGTVRDVTYELTQCQCFDMIFGEITAMMWPSYRYGHLELCFMRSNDLMNNSSFAHF